MRFNNTTYPETPTYPRNPLVLSSFYSSIPYNPYHHSSFSSPAASDSYVPPAGDEVLEALTHNITTTPAGDPIDAFFTAKKTFAARSVEDILTSLYERETLKYDNLRDIDYQSTTLRTRLFELQRWRLGLNPQMESARLFRSYRITDFVLIHPPVPEAITRRSKATPDMGLWTPPQVRSERRLLYL